MEGRLVLEIAEAVPRPAADDPILPPISLRLVAGDLALIDAPDPRRAAWFADLCSGLVPLAKGKVQFLGHDWAAMPRRYAGALRGRIGRVFARGGWIDLLDTANNVLLPQLHHTRRAEKELRERGAELALRFGLPGLPMGRPVELSSLDLARAACVRAFIGKPDLLLLESPLQGRFADLTVPLLEALSEARSDGAAAIWLAGSEMLWGDRTAPATQRLRLRETGLMPARRAA